MAKKRTIKFTKKKIIVVIPSAKNKCLVINFQRTTNLFNTPTSAFVYSTQLIIFFFEFRKKKLKHI